MIHSDYKLRPSAKEILDSPIIRDQVHYDKRKTPTTTFKYFSCRFVICLHYLHSINIDMNM